MNRRTATLAAALFAVGVSLTACAPATDDQIAEQTVNKFAESVRNLDMDGVAAVMCEGKTGLKLPDSVVDRGVKAPIDADVVEPAAYDAEKDAWLASVEIPEFRSGEDDSAHAILEVAVVDGAGCVQSLVMA